MRKRRYGRNRKGRRASKSPKRSWYQGVYEVKNPKKYIGRTSPIYRSSWEFAVMVLCDNSSCVLEWDSERPKIKYVNPITNTVWKYHPDFYIKLTDGKSVWCELIEIKPYKQTLPPKPVKQGRSRKLFESETKTYIVNQAKWNAARAYCKMRRWKFSVVTEKQLDSLKRIFMQLSESISNS